MYIRSFLTSVFAGTILACTAAAGTAAATPSPSGPACGAQDMTITFIRHGESAGNASGRVDTKTPGPVLTEKGRVEAQKIATKFATTTFDGVWASTMVRTQQTAEPTAKARGETVQVQAGFRELEAGDLEGTLEKDAATKYFAAPQKWLDGDLDARIPGSMNGHEFNKRFTDAVQAVANTCDRTPVVFAHGGSIMLWNLQNVKGTDKSYLKTKSLKNTGYVVIKGSTTKGWTLIEWVSDPSE